MESYSLLEINKCIRQQMKDAMPGLYWVVAEINEIHVNSAGHCFMELIEKAPQGVQITARARANIWAYQFRMLSPYFTSMTGQTLSAGMKVMLQTSVEFHELYGLSLQITDINPAFTTGELAIQRQAVIRQLTDEGVSDMNRELELPLVPQRIAVISSGTAAGYGDFVDQLLHHPRGYAFNHTLFQAVMQGNEAEDSIIRALEDVFKREDEFDAVVLIRGGGSQSDLNCFNSYQLAGCIAQFPLPVITGIGHDRDETVADMVACVPLKTPTAVAEFLIHRAMTLDNLLKELYRQLSDAAMVAIRNPADKLQHLSQRLQTIMHSYVRVKDREIHILQVKLANAVQSLLIQKKNQIIWLEDKLHLLDPVNLLRMGYSITLANGKALRNALMLEEGQLIETILHDGRVESVVRGVKFQE